MGESNIMKYKICYILLKILDILMMTLNVIATFFLCVTFFDSLNSNFSFIVFFSFLIFLGFKINTVFLLRIILVICFCLIIFYYDYARFIFDSDICMLVLAGVISCFIGWLFIDNKKKYIRLVACIFLSLLIGFSVKVILYDTIFYDFLVEKLNLVDTIIVRINFLFGFCSTIYIIMGILLEDTSKLKLGTELSYILLSGNILLLTIVFILSDLFYG